MTMPFKPTMARTIIAARIYPCAQRIEVGRAAK